MILHYFKVALRNLLKYKTHSLISAICLSVGMVCFTLVGYFINSIDGSVRKFPNYERRIDIRMPIENDPSKSIAWMLRANEVKTLEERKVEGIEMLSYHSFRNDAEMLFIDREQKEYPFQIILRYTNNAFFNYNNSKLLYGNNLPQFPDEVVISESCARKIYGDKNPVGMLVIPLYSDEAKEKKAFKIVNVCQDLPMEQNLNADLFIPCEGNNYKDNLQLQGLLAENADLKQVNNALEQIKTSRGGGTLHFTAVLLSDQLDNPMRVLMMGFVTFLSSLILLSGIINFLKFIIQMFYNRQRELALRKYMGSSAKGMFSLLFAEVVWMLSVSFLLSLALTEVIIPAIYSYIPQDKMIPIEMSDIYWTQFEVFIGLLLICMIVIMIPIRRMQSVSIIRHISRHNGQHLFRNVMMGFQLCISIFFLGVASIFVLSILKTDSYVYNPISENDAQRVIRMNINSISMSKQKEMILADIRQLSEIEQIIFTSRSENAISSSFIYTNYKEKNGNDVYVAVQNGSPEYFKFLHIPLNGKKVDTNAQGVVLISEAFASRLEKDSVQGMVKLGEDTYRIGGVYKALYKENLRSNELVGSVFFPSQDSNSFYFRIHENGNVEKVMDEIRMICRRYVPESLSLSLHTLDEEKKLDNSGMEMMRDIFFLLAVVSILLVTLSIYSSISMDTMSRQKEVAIRKINGATPCVIALIFGKTYCIIYLFAFAIAFPLVYLLVKQIDSQGKILDIFDIGCWFIGLFTGIAALVVLTTGFKIYRIMHINPSKIIKTE